MRITRALAGLVVGAVSVVPLFVALAQQPTPRRPGDYLIEITEGLGRADQRLGDLRSKGMFPTDIELRFWSGYGFGGTRAIIVKRTSGHWTAHRVTVRECRLYLPVPVGDTLSDASRIRYEAAARRKCGQTGPVPKDGGVLIFSGTLDMTDVRGRTNLADVWQELAKAGVESLTPNVRPLSIDGHGYVVQLRVGRTYRVSFVEDVNPPVTPADTIVQRIYAILSRDIGWRDRAP